MQTITDEILKTIREAVDICTKKLPFDRTVNAKILERTAHGYIAALEGRKLQVEDGGHTDCSKNDSVRITIPQNDLSRAYVQGKNHFSKTR